jgi:hypothetical protein
MFGQITNFSDRRAVKNGLFRLHWAFLALCKIFHHENVDQSGAETVARLACAQECQR